MPDEPQRTAGFTPDTFANLTADERTVADLIRAHRRANPIPLKELVVRTSFSERTVKLIVGELIVKHGMKIGASRELPRAGYFLCANASGVEAAVRPLRSTAESLRKRINALTREQF